MKTIFALASVLALAGTAALAGNPVEGTWKTKVDDNGKYGYVQIKPCGPGFCGTLIKAFDSAGKEYASENIGKRIVWDMKPYDNGLYDDGKVWSPDRNKTYDADMTLKGNSLAVRGCVMFICRDGGTWTRVK